MGDTLLDGLVYNKIYEGTSFEPATLYGATRVIGDSVLFRVINEIESCVGHSSMLIGEEYLLYNFGVSLNDTFFIGNGVQLTCTEVDTIFVQGNRLRRIFVSSYDDGFFIQDEWIYGIGSSRGPLASEYYNFEDFGELICFKDNNLTYFDPDAGSICGFSSTHNTDKERSTCAIYPNPVESGQMLFFKDLNVTEVILTDIHGKQLASSLNNPDMSSLYIPTIIKGLYIVNTIDDSGHLNSFKLIVY